MKTAKDLRSSWNNNDTLRDAWQKVTDSPEWHAVSTLLASEASKVARSLIVRGDGDPVASRLLMKMDGIHHCLETLQTVFRDPAPAFLPEQDYDDDYVKKMKALKDAERQ